MNELHGRFCRIARALLLLVFLQANARSQVIAYVTDPAFNGNNPVTPNNPGDDDAVGIRQTVLTALQLADPQGVEAWVLFPPGVYHCSPYPAGFPNSTIWIATPPGLSRSTPLILAGVGAKIVTRNAPLAAHVVCIGKDNVGLLGLTFEHDPLPFTQGTIQTVLSPTEFDVAIDTGFLSPTGPEFDAYWSLGVPYVNSNTITVCSPSGNFKPGSNVFNRHAPDPAGMLNPVYQVGGLHRFRLEHADALPSVGDRVHYAMRTGDGHGIGFMDCDNVVLQSVTLHSASTYGFVFRNTSHITMDACRAVPAPAGSGGRGPALWSVNADCVSIAGCRTPTYINRCEFEGGMDDGLNVNVWGQEIVAVSPGPGPNKQTLTVRTNNQELLAGDYLQLTDTNFYMIGDLVQAEQVSPGVGVCSIIVSPTVTPLPGGMVFNASQASPFSRIERTKWTRIRGGVHAQIPGSTFLGCTLKDSHAGILMDASFMDGGVPWGPVAMNVTLDGFTVDNVGTCGNLLPPWTRAIFWARQSIGVRLRNTTVDNGQLQSGLIWEKCVDFAIDNLHVNNTASNQAGTQITIRNSSGMITNSTVGGTMPSGGMFSQVNSALTQAGNSWPP